MPKAKNKWSKTSTAPKAAPSETQGAERRTLRPRPAAASNAASNAVAVPVKPRQCTICGRPRLGHPRQCKDGPSAGSRLANLDDAANEREAQILVEEARFIAGQAAEAQLGEHHMDVDEDATGEPQASAPSNAQPASTLQNDNSHVAGAIPPGTPPLDATLPPSSEVPSAAPPPSSNAAAALDPALAAPSPLSADLADTQPAKPAAAEGREKLAKTPFTESEPLEGGLRSTPAGDLPLPMKRSSKTKEEYDSRKASKKTTDMFTSMAMTGDLLASRVPGWAFCIFVPMARRGEMRSWTSTKVRGDVPELPAEIRQLIFERLEPFREQADDERELVLQEKENLIKEKDSQLEHYKRLAEDAEQRALEKEREAEALRSAYASGKALVN